MGDCQLDRVTKCNIIGSIRFWLLLIEHEGERHSIWWWWWCCVCIGGFLELNYCDWNQSFKLWHGWTCQLDRVTSCNLIGSVSFDCCQSNKEEIDIQFGDDNDDVCIFWIFRAWLLWLKWVIQTMAWVIVNWIGYQPQYNKVSQVLIVVNWTRRR